MRSLILYLSLLSISLALQAQNRDLDFYLERAKINSPLLQRSLNENEIITLDLKQVKSVLSKPEITGEANLLFAPIVSHDNNSTRFEWVSEGATDYSGYDLALTDGGQYQAGIALKQPLFTGSVFQSYSKKAELSQEINSNNMDLTVHEIEQLVSYQYILCLKATAQAQINLALLTQIDEQLNLLQILVENAVYKETDAMLLQIERSNYEASFKLSKADYRNSLFDLNLICGISDTALVDLEEIHITLNPDTRAPSKFISVYRLDSMNLLADLAIFDQKYRPKLFLFADAGLNAVYLPGFNRLGFSTGLSFNWTIYDGHQRDLEQQKAKINLNTIEFEKSAFITKTDLQKRKIVYQIQSIERQKDIAVRQISQYEMLINAYQTELSFGEVSVMDLKNLLKDLASKKQLLVLLDMERLAMINSYNYWNY